MINCGVLGADIHNEYDVSEEEEPNTNQFQPKSVQQQIFQALVPDSSMYSRQGKQINKRYKAFQNKDDGFDGIQKHDNRLAIEIDKNESREVGNRLKGRLRIMRQDLKISQFANPRKSTTLIQRSIHVFEKELRQSEGKDKLEQSPGQQSEQPITRQPLSFIELDFKKSENYLKLKQKPQKEQIIDFDEKFRQTSSYAILQTQPHIYSDQESKPFKAPTREQLKKHDNDWHAKVPSSQYYRPNYEYQYGHVPSTKIHLQDNNEGRQMKRELFEKRAVCKKYLSNILASEDVSELKLRRLKTIRNGEYNQLTQKINKVGQFQYGYDIHHYGSEYQIIKSRPFKNVGEDSMQVVKNRRTLYDAGSSSTIQFDRISSKSTQLPGLQVHEKRFESIDHLSPILSKNLRVKSYVSIAKAQERDRFSCLINDNIQSAKYDVNLSQVIERTKGSIPLEKQLKRWRNDDYHSVSMQNLTSMTQLSARDPYKPQDQVPKIKKVKTTVRQIKGL